MSYKGIPPGKKGIDMFDIPLIRPFISEEVKQSVIAVLDSGHLTEGKVTRDLEAAVENFIGVKHCIAVTSCTTGLELALRCLDIGRGDHVIVPAFTYPATADVVRIVGADPVFVDVDRDTMLMDYNDLRKAITPATKAVIPVSLFGNPLDYDTLDLIKKEFGIFILEDAACALSAEFKGVPTGRRADITVFSLHPRKFVTTGEGGLITTDNDNWASWIRSYKRFGIAAEGAEIKFADIGTNCKLSDILAAVGVAQMQQIENLIAQRQKLAAGYLELLETADEIQIPKTTPHGKHAYQSFCVFVKHRDAVLERMRSRGIEVQIGSYFLPGQPAFHDLPNSRSADTLEGSLRADAQCLALPLYHQMTTAHQEQVTSALKEAIAWKQQ
jgi:dTDP-4-amino-4,6-dideoxygalactose transaminase